MTRNPSKDFPFDDILGEDLDHTEDTVIKTTQGDTYNDSYFRTVSVLVGLAITAGLISTVVELSAIIHDTVFDRQLHGKVAFDPNKNPPGFPAEPLLANPLGGGKNDTFHMKKLLSYPVNLLNRDGPIDLVYVVTLSMVLFVIVFHCTMICFIDGIRATSRISMGVHLGSGCISLFLSILYLLHLGTKPSVYIAVARGYSAFGHQFDTPYTSTDHSDCFGLDTCFHDFDPPAPLPAIQWMRIKREALNLEYIFRICSKNDKDFLTLEDAVESKQFKLNQIRIKNEEYGYGDLKRMGLCRDSSYKFASGALGIFSSVFSIMAGFIIFTNGEDEMDKPGIIEGALRYKRHKTADVYDKNDNWFEVVSMRFGNEGKTDFENIFL